MNKLVLNSKEYQLSDDLVKHLEQTITEQDEVKVGRWVPEKDCMIWYLDAWGNVSSRRWTNSPVDKFALIDGKIFESEEDTEAHLTYLKALATIKDDAEWWTPDWEDEEQDKWYINFDHSRKDLTLDYTRDTQDMNVVYFEDPENLKESRDLHRKEWLTIFGIKDA